MKFFLYPLLTILLISACSKKNNVTPTSTNATLLTGSWLTVSERDRIYTFTANTLLEDTTYAINMKMYQTSNAFNKNGTYVDYFSTPVLDTIIKAHYSVSGQTINYTYDSNGVQEQYTILNISNTNLTLEQIFSIGSEPGVTQNLPPGIYKCVADVDYIKQ